MLSGELREKEIQNLSYQIEYKKHLIGIRFNEADSIGTEYIYDSYLTASTGKQIGYLEKCNVNGVDFIREYYNALCILDDCVNTGNDSKKDSALRAYKKLSCGIDSAIGSIQIGGFAPDNILLDYVKKISMRKATVLLSEIAV
ncbi:MAG: hypothetical protein KAJ56_05330 [Candidatus Aenigmarchaeota archaeon]|nr:hypothetical protein [Candidatus Aenigmarchaeota archaeon]